MTIKFTKAIVGLSLCFDLVESSISDSLMNQYVRKHEMSMKFCPYLPLFSISECNPVHLLDDEYKGRKEDQSLV